MSDTKIEWTDKTWNPIVGCSVVSPGCTNCYAMRMASRIVKMQDQAYDATEARRRSPYRGTTEPSKAGPVWTGKVALASDDTLTSPLSWKKPARIFVNSMGDLFHESVPDEWIDRVFAVMALSPQHTFQVLTKRSKRMLEYMTGELTGFRIRDAMQDLHRQPVIEMDWPLPNVHLGVSAEDQPRADERIPDLLATPAAVRFVSAEPLLGQIDFENIDYLAYMILYGRGPRTENDPIIKYDVLRGHMKGPDDIGLPKLDWIIVGGESGKGARGCWVPNIRSIVLQCKKAGVAVYVKQMGTNVQDRNDAGFEGCEPDEWPDIDPFDVEHDIDGYCDEAQGAPVRIRLKDRKGGDMAEWPEDLRVREFPR